MTKDDSLHYSSSIKFVCLIVTLSWDLSQKYHAFSLPTEPWAHKGSKVVKPLAAQNPACMMQTSDMVQMIEAHLPYHFKIYIISHRSLHTTNIGQLFVLLECPSCFFHHETTGAIYNIWLRLKWNLKCLDPHHVWYSFYWLWGDKNLSEVSPHLETNLALIM